MDNKIYIQYNNDTKIVNRITDNELLLDDNCSIVEIEGTMQNNNYLSYFNCIYQNGKFVENEELKKQSELNELRDKRISLLSAFDVYKSNLIIGAIDISEEDKQEIISWYKSILDLDEDAINNPPSLILKYLN